LDGIIKQDVVDESRGRNGPLFNTEWKKQLLAKQIYDNLWRRKK